MENRSLWIRFLDGDNTAYVALYKKHVDSLFAYGMCFTPNRELVKDCVHDVFVKIYKNRNRLHPVDNVKVYLFIALKNSLFNSFGNEKSFYSVDDIEPVFDVEYSQEDRMIADEHEQESAGRINRLLEILTPRQKEAIYYRYVEGLGMDEICRLMNMNYQSGINLIQRSIKKIRTAIDIKKVNKYNIKFYMH